VRGKDGYRPLPQTAPQPSKHQVYYENAGVVEKITMLRREAESLVSSSRSTLRAAQQDVEIGESLLDRLRQLESSARAEGLRLTEDREISAAETETPPGHKPGCDGDCRPDLPKGCYPSCWTHGDIRSGAAERAQAADRAAGREW
jgi:hypothetical protein